MAGNPLINIFRTQELRNRILFTIAMLVIFRLGASIPLPGIDYVQLKSMIETGRVTGGEENINILDYLDLFVGGALKNYSVFMLGIMPYITCSIIMNLLVIIFPKLKKIQEEKGGKKKIQKITRWATVGVTFVQTYFFINSSSIFSALAPGIDRFWFIVLACTTVTSGTLFLMWLGEQITQRGIGNGSSMIIMAGIVVRFPDALIQLGIIKSFLRFIEDIGVLTGFAPRHGTLVPVLSKSASEINPIFIIIVLALFVVIVALVIFEQRGQRKIPVHYAKRVVGRKMYGSQNTYLPFKLNPSGVIPIIFANTVLIFPIQIVQGLAQQMPFLNGFLTFFRPNDIPYLVAYSLLIVFFAYFYTQVTLNPFEISRQIRENGGSIPGIRSEMMEQYLTRILNRIILPGSLFLAFIAIIPTLITKLFGFPWAISNIMGGTSLLIVVGVGLDTMSQIEGHLRMHYHDGLVKKGKIKGRNL